MRKPGVPVDSEDAAFCLKPFIDRIEFDDLANYCLDESFIVLPGFIILAAVVIEPFPFIIKFQSGKKSQR
jgi:hypothetical protein